jgi:hypothetical protein
LRLAVLCEVERRRQPRRALGAADQQLAQAARGEAAGGGARVRRRRPPPAVAEHNRTGVADFSRCRLALGVLRYVGRAQARTSTAAIQRLLSLPLRLLVQLLALLPLLLVVLLLLLPWRQVATLCF